MFAHDLMRFAAVVLVALAAGLVTGHVTLMLLAACLIYLAWQHANLVRLYRWLQQRKDHDPPEYPGVFEEICVEVDKLRERHKKRKKKLARYLSQFQQATKALPDATVVMDSHGSVRWANKAASQSLGINYPADLDRRITNLVRSPELRDFLEQRRPESTLNLTSPTTPGMHLSLRLVPYGTDEWLLVARDVTELQRAHQVRSDFVANVSHELRTPITVFRGYLENLEALRDRFPPEWRTAFEHMKSHAERMQSTIEELLLLSRLELGTEVPHQQAVPVPELLADIQKQARALSKDNAHLFSLAVDADLVILGDFKELYSAFSNIIFNAVKYTPARGIIQIRWYRDSQGAHLEVEDNGIGIPAHELPRITERFYRVDEGRSRATGGSGLGLAIVKHVLQRHKATLHVESEVGKGSIFRCDFPPEAIIDVAEQALDELA
jgi:two-component system phosphate regulon sensor histidine kinase PhoR